MVSVFSLDPGWYKIHAVWVLWSTVARHDAQKRAPFFLTVGNGWRKVCVNFEIGSRIYTSEIFWWWASVPRREWGTEFPHIRHYFYLNPRLSNPWTERGSETHLWKIQVHKSVTRLHFAMPFEIYKKDNVCNILQKLTNSSIILNNLLMCCDLHRDFVLLKNFQM